MVNLLGDLWLTAGSDEVVQPSWAEVLADPHARLHLYGKALPRAGRKMGHLTVLGDDVDEVPPSAAPAPRCPSEIGETRAGRRRRWADATPPERIDVADAGVVLRRHQPGDVDALQAVIEASREHLRPFMPWADQDRDATAAFVANVGEVGLGESYSYLVTEQGAARQWRAPAGRLRPASARRSGDDRDRLLAAPRRRRPRGDDSCGSGLTTAAFALDGITRWRSAAARRTSAARRSRRLGFATSVTRSTSRRRRARRDAG